MDFRIEHDYLGEVKVPKDAYWGAQTQRAVENFPISGLRPYPEFISALIMVKKAAAQANLKTGVLDKKKAEAIISASDEILSGKLKDQFVVDVYQAGAGTSNNMNANEVIANRAIELLGGKKGDYSMIHPNDDVNKSQSTNDVIPTTMRLTIITLLLRLKETADYMEMAFMKKAKEFDGIVKSGRTHLMDAAPIRLGQEFEAWARMISKSKNRIDVVLEKLKEINIGATAVGTGLNADPRYRDLTIEYLSKISGLDLRPAQFLPEATQSLADFLEASSVVRSLAADMVKITNDIRLLNSGPITGFDEISLPPVQPGSSIMPGKVNPSMAEAVLMVSFQVIGNDDVILLCTQAGQLELNITMPLVIYVLSHSITILNNVCKVFVDKALNGITAHKEQIEEEVSKTPGVALALNPYIGYEKAAEVVKRALKEGKSIKDTAKEMKVLPDKKLDEIFDPYRLTSIYKDKK
ncbi:MAG: aspartate ammonia-lyase [Candidatus Parvarchaeota archaeon]|nr:aspartate ammonia-lyase [Candidatus Parvarchaeota archaeon]MCL5101537.1 aspartate ammonia-lyase [Candidatus Parvarchaeota archaeon]